jgi:hypothetical protein
MATTLLRDPLGHESAASGVVQTSFEFQLVGAVGREGLLPLMKWVVFGGGAAGDGADGYGAAPDAAAAEGAAAGDAAGGGAAAKDAAGGDAAGGAPDGTFPVSKG